MTNGDTPYPGAGCLLRLFWLFAGNFLLAVLIAQKFQSRAAGLTLGDAAFWLIILSIVVVRYLDVRFLAGTTGFGQPASGKDVKRHAVLLVLLAGGAWAVVHLISTFTSKAIG